MFGLVHDAILAWTPYLVIACVFQYGVARYNVNLSGSAITVLDGLSSLLHQRYLVHPRAVLRYIAAAIFDDVALTPIHTTRMQLGTLVRQPK
jgi:hypothetical protein